MPPAHSKLDAQTALTMAASDLPLGFYPGSICLRFLHSWVWDATAYPKSSSHCHTLWLDSKSQSIEALCSRKSSAYISSHYKDGMLYRLRRFRVIPPKHNYRACRGQTCLLITEETDIRPIDRRLTTEPFPPLHLPLTPFTHLARRAGQCSRLIDIAGRIASFSPPANQPDGACLLVLEDSGKNRVMLRMKRNLATLLDSLSLAQYERLGPVIFAFTGLLVSKEAGNPRLNIRSFYLETTPATQYIEYGDTIQLLSLYHSFTDRNVPITLFPLPEAGRPVYAQGLLPERHTINELLSLFTADPEHFVDYHRCQITISQILLYKGWLEEECSKKRYEIKFVGTDPTGGTIFILTHCPAMALLKTPPKTFLPSNPTTEASLRAALLRLKGRRFTMELCRANHHILHKAPFEIFRIWEDNSIHM